MRIVGPLPKKSYFTISVDIIIPFSHTFPSLMMAKRRYSKCSLPAGPESIYSTPNHPISKKPNIQQPTPPYSMKIDTPTSEFYIHPSATQCLFQQRSYRPGIFGNRKISCYQLISKLGEGAFGVVYKGIYRITNETYAIKKLELGKRAFPIETLREISILKKCGSHENIIDLREVVEGASKSKMIYLVMDYMDWDLKAFVSRLKSKFKRFGMEHIKSLLFQLLSGVSYLHEECVIHRDLKPSNLLLNKSGLLKIADFGISRECGNPIKPYTPTVVTLWYRAPELLLGTKTYSTEIDIWSVGCILAELLTFKPIFCGETEIEQVKKIFSILGTPSEATWDGFHDLPFAKYFAHPKFPGDMKPVFGSNVVFSYGYEFLMELLAYDPKKRVTAKNALKNIWFCGNPWPCSIEKFSKWIKGVVEL